LTEQRETSGKKVADIIDKLKVLFEEYERSLNEFGVRPAPLPADLGLPEFMEWIDAEFKALPEVISGANDFAAAFSVESILKLLHDFDCADRAKFREKLPHFLDTLSTSRLRPNEDIQAIRSKFAREFWLASGKEVVKNIARAKLAQVNFRTVLFAFVNSQSFSLLIFLTSSSLPLLANQRRETRENTASPESSTEDEESRDRVRRTLATAAMTTTMVTMSPSKRRTLRRLTSRAKHRRNICPSWLFMYICTFI
jgi:hypothetical protein